MPTQAPEAESSEDATEPPDTTILAASAAPDSIVSVEPTASLSMAPDVSPSVASSPAPAQSPAIAVVPPFDIAAVPDYAGEPYVQVNGNKPYFTTDELTTESFEWYSELDALGRCGVTCACVGQDLMPTEDRGYIGMVRPSGWHLIRYDGLVDGNYLYNCCHLIGRQLTGEDANVQNLIT